MVKHQEEKIFLRKEDTKAKSGVLNRQRQWSPVGSDSSKMLDSKEFEDHLK